jgi:glyoxylase-like metal-dependent hydrolase (beta-lactamase superfamily II)
MKKTKKLPGNMFTVAPGVWGMKDTIVNFYMIQDLTTNEWVLIDSGLKWSAPKIKMMAAYLFGKDSKPMSIILTHGHFDHVGSVKKLAEEWDVPVYAHYMEIPYLTGRSSYPPPDPTVGGGMMASLAFMYPKSPINIWQYVRVLPSDGTIPGLNGWQYIHTPGHAPGHISLFREDDKVLVAGDAFVTTKQESAISIMTNRKELTGPPKYFTTDWDASEMSVRKLAYLHPNTAATGHGMPMRGNELKGALEHLVNNFEKEAVPANGRYVHNAAVADANGTVYVPGKQPANASKIALQAFGVTAAITFGFILKSRANEKRRKYNQNMLDIEYNY